MRFTPTLETVCIKDMEAGGDAQRVALGEGRGCDWAGLSTLPSVIQEYTPNWGWKCRGSCLDDNSLYRDSDLHHTNLWLFTDRKNGRWRGGHPTSPTKRRRPRSSESNQLVLWKGVSIIRVIRTEGSSKEATNINTERAACLGIFIHPNPCEALLIDLCENAFELWFIKIDIQRKGLIVSWQP
jgi:hypothetical protein